MKQFLIFLLVAAIVVVAIVLIKNPDKLTNLVDQKNTGMPEDITGPMYDSPSVNESGSFSIDKKTTSFSIASDGKEAVNLDIKSGNLIVESGNISGGTIVLSPDGLKKLTGAQSVVDGDMKLDIKALVFERQKSTIDNLVYRTDTELTMNGKTYPVSFNSTFRYQPGEYYIRGTTTVDWKNWSVTSDAGTSMTINMVIRAIK